MRKHKSDRIIGVLTVILLGVGLIVIYAIGPMRANVMNATYGTDYSENYFFLRQLLNVVLAMAVFIAAFKLPYAWVKKWGKVVLIVGLLACAALMVLSWTGSSMASCELGACRWIKVGGGISFQPAEIVKFGLVLYLAELMAERKKQGKLTSWSDFWLPFVIVCGLSLGFVVVVQKDLGTGVSMMAIIVAMLFMSGVPMRYFGMALGVIGVCGVLAIVSSPHRIERLLTFNDADSSDSYHIENAMIAIGTGGFFGVGIGNSVQATGYLPESINDSVFAVMGETFGFVGLVAVVVCFAVLLLRLLRTANYLHDDEESLVVIGVFAWATAHVVVNIASMTGLLPLTGITLPLLSYGGTSMLFMAAALGLALQLSCYTSREPRKEEVVEARNSSAEIVRRRQQPVIRRER
jgi:cell division protein FtsW